MPSETNPPGPAASETPVQDEPAQPGLEPRAEPAAPQKIRVSFRYLLKNLISLMGLAGAALFGLILLFVILLDMLGAIKEQNVYSGMLTYMVLPGLFIASVAFTVLGMFWKLRQTRKRGTEVAVVPGHTLKGKVVAVTAAVCVTLVWVGVTTYGTYTAYHYTDSTAFCGLACHQIMEPEYTAYLNSPHARVKCVDCHIGPGAGWFVKSKLSGLNQVWAVARGTYKTPIQTPLHNLRPAKETCEQCHWPRRFSGSVERVVTHYAADDENTPTRFNLLIRVGGGHAEQGQPSGVHWHVSDHWTVQYLAADEKRQELPYVRVTYKDGRREEFASAGFDRATLDESKLRTMDCLDCHSRPAHVFSSPVRALDEAMDKGLISPALRGIKRAALKALQAEYETKAEALSAIDAALDAYAREHPPAPGQHDLLAAARQNIKKIYQTHFFPEHKVDYRAFINNLGHFDHKGCERCHDGKHLSANGKGPITQSCTACHQLVGQATGLKEVEGMQYKRADFQHPEDPVNLKKPCSSCHALKKDGN